MELDAKNSGLNYAWNTGASTQKIKVTETGTYSVNVTDEIGCLGSDAIQITVNPMPVVNLGNDTSFCKGASHILKAGNNGFNYAWSTGANTQEITVNQSGTYEVRVFDAIGCADTSKIKIVVKELPVVKLGNDTTICATAFVDLDAKNPGLNYAWNTGASTQKIKVTETGTYSVNVTDEIGCLGSDEIKITVNPMPVVNLGKDTSFCKGASHTLKAGNNGFNYLWSTGANTQEITVNQSGTYEVRVFDAIGCADTSKIKIVVKELPVVKLGNDTTICATAFVDLDAKNPGLNYAWNTGASAQKIKVTETGTYSVNVTDEIGCLGTDNIFITKEIIEDPYPDKDIVFCLGTTVTLKPDFVNNYTIYWENDKNNSLKNWADPVYREKVVAAQKRVQGTEEARSMKSEASKRTWADTAVRNKRTDGIKRSRSTNQSKQKTSDSAKAMWSDPNYHAMQAANNKEIANREEVKAAKKAAAKALWADPVWREKMMAARKKRIDSHPNN